MWIVGGICKPNTVTCGLRDSMSQGATNDSQLERQELAICFLLPGFHWCTPDCIIRAGGGKSVSILGLKILLAYLLLRDS